MQKRRNSPLNITPEEFREKGTALVEALAIYLDAIEDIPVTSGKTVAEIREVLGQGDLPMDGSNFEKVWSELPQMLVENSLHNGHPRFAGYIMGSPSPIGALGDLLAAMINPNMGGWNLTPMASEIEVQTIKWIASLIGYPEDCGGLLVSGGTMANYTGFLAARTHFAGQEVRTSGLRGMQKPMTLYCARGTHTWIQKAADLFGFGTDQIRWIAVHQDETINTEALIETIHADIEAGSIPFLVIGNAGTVSTGTVDHLDELADICEEYRLWFHVDGAYGGAAACIPELKDMFKGIERADSIALDPHKWLYAPIEAGCVLIRDRQWMLDAFSYRPPYYRFSDEDGINFYEYGLQNSRGFRALKVWLNLQKAGRKGYEEMMREDIRLAEEFASHIENTQELELNSRHLSIVTFRYIPKEGDYTGEQLNALNEKLMGTVQQGGMAFFSNAVSGGKFLLRACILNFRTTSDDVRAFVDLVVEEGRKLVSEGV